MSELQDMLRVQARLHRKQGANALGQLFESAIEEIQLLKKTYNQLFDAFQDCQGELAKANERVAKLERENTNGNAAAELLIWWAKKLSNAPNEDLKEVIRIGYKRIVNLANLIGEEQLRKEQNND